MTGRQVRSEPHLARLTSSQRAWCGNRHLDTNGDGLVSEEELWHALGDLGLGGTARTAAQEMVGEVGSHSGGVTVQDFLHFIRRVRGMGNIRC